MKAEIIAFEKQTVQAEQLNEETKKKEVVNIPVAMITLRADLPKNLPVGQIVELTVVKEKKEEGEK